MEQDFGKILAAWMSGIWIFMGNFKGRRILQFLRLLVSCGTEVILHMIALIAEFDPAKARAIWMGLSTDGARRLEDLCREPSATMATH